MLAISDECISFKIWSIWIVLGYFHLPLYYTSTLLHFGGKYCIQYICRKTSFRNYSSKAQLKTVLGCCCNWSCVRCPPVSNTSPSSWSSTWKLIQLAVPASTRQWITSFLNDRRQQVRLGSITSSTQTTLSLILFCLSSFWSCPLILLNTTVNSALLTIALPSAY